MRDTHLSQDERYQIYALRLEKKTLKEIADALHRDKSCICRELKRKNLQKSVKRVVAMPGASRRLTGSKWQTTCSGSRLKPGMLAFNAVFGSQ
ncbi:MAG: helix-turn-helix domain-containing protein [Burkholderiaceae bacterium]